jgi:hypothetical protein
MYYLLFIGCCFAPIERSVSRTLPRLSLSPIETDLLGIDVVVDIFPYHRTPIVHWAQRPFESRI